MTTTDTDLVAWGNEFCDRCGPSAKARFLVYKEIDDEPLLLTFCLHCGNEHMEGLREDGWEVDEVE